MMLPIEDNLWNTSRLLALPLKAHALKARADSHRIKPSRAGKMRVSLCIHKPLR